MSKHTPGPWKFDADDVCWNVQLPSPEGEYGFREISVEGWSDKEAISNARLIAAAPDLLAACKALLTLLQSSHWSEPTGYPAPEVSLALDAIAKAEGTDAP